MNSITNGHAVKCPGREELVAFSTGRLSDTTVVAVAEHLGTCALCASLLQSLDTQVESLFASMRGADPFADLLDEPEFEKLRARAKAIDVVRPKEKPGVDSSVAVSRCAESTDVTVRPPPAATVSWNQHRELQQIDGAESIPESIGRFFVLRLLGVGGFAAVYLAKDPASKELVAIKVPRRDKLRSQGSIERFLKEARTVAELAHGSIVQVGDFGRDDEGSCFLVMQYIEGPSLKELLERERLSYERSADLIADVAEALHVAHERKVYHRDIKPSNILLDSQGKPFLSDFGLAILDEERWTHRDQLAGTYAYMSPEQMRRETQFIDCRTDVWSLGVTLYEMLTRERPFTGRTFEERFEEILHRQASPRLVDGNIPPELDRICRKCLEKQVDNRYTSAMDLADDLRRWKQDRLDSEGGPRVAASVAEADAEPAAQDAVVEEGLEASVPSPKSLRPRVAAAFLVLSVVCVAIVSAYSLWIRPVRHPIAPEIPGPVDTADRAPVDTVVRPSVDTAAKAGIPYPLLEDRPRKLLWPAGASDDELRFHNDEQVLEIANPLTGMRLVELNETSASSFILEMAMSKKGEWDGHAGVFWGFHVIQLETGVERAECRAVLLQYDKNRHEYRLHGATLEFDRLYADAPDITITSLGHKVAAPAGLSCSLAVNVRNGRLANVDYNRVPIPLEWYRDLRKPDFCSKAIGAFGVLNSGGTTRFHAQSTRFTLLKETGDERTVNHKQD